ncbi:siderophore amonabactin TonB-dependent receptor [Acinetobacter apis]|uniref:Outer membrane receptor for ferrienterochelin and colicins n=1 Tax=Acinetobacter apis TaxID=1229165 RepID=A0A217EH72_9GAMM|nr:TonB-dependent receptor [Acinetobacter apis]SNQ29530.1 outer membrane receptor for ferrienterochelin and colicins [Acinetobacter apis]
MKLIKPRLGLAITGTMILSIQVYAEDTTVVDEPKAQQLETIVVSASLKKQDIQKAPASMSVVTSEDIERSAALNIADVLQREAGVYNYNTGIDKVLIRGMQDTSGSYTLILLNGKRMSSSGAMWRGNDFDWSSIPLNSIDRIEVIRGPMSSLYGSDAMGGVINIITKKAKPGETTGSIFAQFNRADTGRGKNQSRYGFNLNTGLTDHLSLRVTGDAYNRDAWYREAAVTKDGAYFVKKETKNINTTLTWDINDQQAIDFDVNYNHDRRPLTQDTSNGFSELEIERTNFGLTHRGHWDWGTTEAYIGKETGKIEDYDSDYDAPQRRNYKQENLIGRVFANFDWWMNSSTVGADYKDQEITDIIGYPNTGGSQQKSYGVFAQNDTHITKDLTLTLGGRYDDFDNFKGKATGKAYLAYELLDGVVVKGGVGQAYKVPSPYQLNESYRFISCGGSCYIRGNANLQPEESTSYEVSLLVKRPDWNFNITAFNNDVENLIERVKDTSAPAGSLFPNKWSNISKANLRGIELAAGYDFNDDLGIKTNATYLETENKTTKKELTERPKWMWNNSVFWTPVENYKVNLSANYIGSQILSSGQKLPSYTTYDVVFSSNLTPKVIVDYGVKNITNVDLEDKNTGFNTKMYGRNYFVKATYNF